MGNHGLYQQHLLDPERVEYREGNFPQGLDRIIHTFHEFRGIFVGVQAP